MRSRVSTRCVRERPLPAERLVVVGGDAAGMTAAAQARRRRAPDVLEIVAFERGRFTSYSACGIPYLVGGLVGEVDALVARSVEEHRARGIDARTGHSVTEIDLTRRSVTVRSLDAARDELVAFDRLVIATGAVPVRPALPGIEGRGVFGVQTLGDGVAVDTFLAQEKPRRAAVVGAGYVGLEMAEAMVRRGLEVVLVEAGPQIMPTLDVEFGALVADAARGLGIEVRTGERVEAFETSDGRVRAVATESGVIRADVVVLGLGVRPASELAALAGVEVGATGGIATDDHMRTSAEGVFAAGDCVESHHRVTGQGMTIALGTHANKQGVVAGINATGGDAVFPGVIGTAASKLCDYEVARTGLTEREATAAGFDAIEATIEATSRAGYYPGAQSMRVKVVVEGSDGRLLGAQIFGRDGAAKRIDVLATCIWNEMTVDEVVGLDLAYAPPFSPVWDPVQVAARAAVARLAD